MKHSLPKAKNASTRTKALVTGGLVALTAAGVGGAAFASFTGTTNASQSVSSGTLQLTQGGTANLTTAASNIAPGDTIQRIVPITTTGNVGLTGMSLTTAATTSSLLDSGANGLRMTIDKCSSPWTPSGNTFTCVGPATVSTVLSDVPVIGAGRTLSNIDTTAGATNNLRVTLTLPTAADDTYQTKASVLSYTFDATQRAGTNQ
jgi:spore coat-associated protein N